MSLQSAYDRIFDVNILYDLDTTRLQAQNGGLNVRPLQESQHLGRLIIDTNCLLLSALRDYPVGFYLCF